MARRNNEAESTATEATATPAESTADEATDETPVDLTAFTEAVDSAIAEADTTTGELPEASKAAVTEAYRAIDGQKGKNAAKEHINKVLTEAIFNDEGPKAKSYVLLRNGLTAGGSAKKASEPKDPTEAYVSRVAVLVAAQEILGNDVPEGVSEDWVTKVTEKAEALVTEARTVLDVEEGADAPEVGSEAKKVLKLASGKVTGGGGSTFTGTRRDVAKHIAEAFEGQPSGAFLSVNEIVKFDSKEYGDDHPSSGAVSARLFPKTGEPNLPEGISPAHPDGKSRGAVKA